MFKVGQKVWCLLYGEGRVDEVTRCKTTFPVSVEFHNHRGHYTSDGRITVSGNRVLFFSKPNITAETEPPFEPTMIGRLILIGGNNCVYEVINETAESVRVRNKYNNSDIVVRKSAMQIADITDLEYKHV